MYTICQCEHHEVTDVTCSSHASKLIFPAVSISPAHHFNLCKLQKGEIAKETKLPANLIKTVKESILCQCVLESNPILGFNCHLLALHNPKYLSPKSIFEKLYCESRQISNNLNVLMMNRF